MPDLTPETPACRQEPVMSEWRYTTDHAASCQGQPVLVSPEGRAFGPGDLLSTTEAGAVLGVSSRRVLALIEASRLPAQRVGGRWVVRVRDLERVRERRNGRPRRTDALSLITCGACGQSRPLAGYGSVPGNPSVPVELCADCF